MFSVVFFYLVMDQQLKAGSKEARPLTLSDVLGELRQAGLRNTARTFWKYAGLGLLPKGEKIAGRGNVLYFPADTVKRLRTIDFLNKDVGIPLRQLGKMRDWFQGEDFGRAVLWQKNPTPLRLVAWFASALADTGLLEKKRLSRPDVAELGKIRDELSDLLRLAGIEW